MSAIATAVLLGRMLAATPLPPAEPDPEGLLEAFAALQDAWQEIMAEVPEPPQIATEAERVIARELGERQAVWKAALSAARDELGAQRMGVGKLRQYADRL